MALLYGRAGRLTAQNGGSRPGQVEMALKLVALGGAGHKNSYWVRLDI